MIDPCKVDEQMRSIPRMNSARMHITVADMIDYMQCQDWATSERLPCKYHSDIFENRNCTAVSKKRESRTASVHPRPTCEKSSYVFHAFSSLINFHFHALQGLDSFDVVFILMCTAASHVNRLLGVLYWSDSC